MEGLIDANAIRYDRLLKTGNKEHPLEWAVSQSAINSMTTVDAVPVEHGRWIMEPNGYGTCSNCKMCSLDIGGGVDSNFCPNCGAKMDEV